MVDDHFGFISMSNAPASTGSPPSATQSEFEKQMALENQRIALENQRLQIEQQGEWRGDDYMKVLQGLGSFAMAGGKTFQDIYLASKANPNNIYANLDLSRQSQDISQMLTQNQNIDANINQNQRIDQTGAVPQVYAPNNTQQAQATTNNEKIMYGVGAVLILLGLVAVIKK